MLVHYKKIGEKSVVVCVIGYTAALFLANEPLKSQLNVSEHLREALAWTGGLGYFIAFWAYAKAKGRSGGQGLGLALLNIIGIAILYKMSDDSGKPADVSCPACSGKNDPSASECRYCRTTLTKQTADVSKSDV